MTICLDLKTGKYVPVAIGSDCDILCTSNNEMNKVREKNCCDDLAICSCGITTGHYACICPVGFFGSGFKGSCQREYIFIFVFFLFYSLYQSHRRFQSYVS